MDNPLDFERPGIGVVLVYMVIEGFVLILLTFVLEVSTCMLKSILPSIVQTRAWISRHLTRCTLIETLSGCMITIYIAGAYVCSHH